MGGATMGVSGTVAACFCALQYTSVAFNFVLQACFAKAANTHGEYRKAPTITSSPYILQAFAYNVDALLDNESSLIQSQFY